MHGITAGLLVYILTCLSGNCHGQDYQADLISYLKNNISNFSPLLPPRLDPNQAVTIVLDTMLSQIVSVNTAKQSITISAFMFFSWPEERLVWNKSMFGGVRVVNWDPTQIWLPVVMVFNGIGDNQVLTAQMTPYLTNISPNLTEVTMYWRREFEFSCSFDMSDFPIDQHMCELEFYFTDQGRGNKMISLAQRTSLAYVPKAIYRENSEWTLLNLSTFAQKRPYSIVQGAPPIALPTYVVRLEIKRVSEYYFMNVITPLLLLTLLQVLVYFLPVESGEKLGFGITIMLSYTVFLLLLDGILPKTQSMPAIASFITAAMILSTISLLLTSLIMRFHFTPVGTPMPACARTVFVRFLGRLFRVRGAARVEQMPSDMTELSGQKTDDGKTGDGAPDAAERSDWILAAYAIERLMVALGILATVVIIAVFIIKPYV